MFTPKQHGTLVYLYPSFISCHNWILFKIKNLFIFQWTWAKRAYVINATYNIMNSLTHNVVSTEIYFPATFFSHVANDKLYNECTSNCHNVSLIILSQLTQMNTPQQRVFYVWPNGLSKRFPYINIYYPTDTKTKYFTGFKYFSYL